MMDSVNQTTGLWLLGKFFFDDLALLNYENQQNMLKKFKQNPPLQFAFNAILSSSRKVVFGS